MQIRGYRFNSISTCSCYSREPGHVQPLGQSHSATQGPHWLADSTHYPLDRATGIEIMQQEAGIDLGGPFPVQVPFFMLEVIEQISRSARKSKYIDHASGVSARLSIANYRMMIASARQRAIRLGENPAVPRVSDLGHIYSSAMGKLELDLMAERRCRKTGHRRRGGRRAQGRIRRVCREARPARHRWRV